MKHVCLCTFGSLGDVYPYVAIALELRKLGHNVTIATNGDHKQLVEKNGVNFLHVRPDVQDLMDRDKDMFRKAMDRRTGAQFVLREIVVKNARVSFDDLFNQAKSLTIDLFVTHPLTYHAILTARKLGTKHVATILSPISFFSKYDAPALPDAEFIPRLASILGTGVTGAFMSLLKASMYSWFEPMRELQSEIGLEVDRRSPFFEGQFSSLKNLALFSRVFAERRPDWPPNAVVTGFSFLDTGHVFSEMDEKIEKFLNSGSPPVVLTLGSSAVFDPGDFYQESIKALKRVGMRGLLLVGPNKIQDAGDDILAVEYASHARIFPRAAAVVHQGGVGTTGQALRSGVPQIVIPHSHDQFDNANRVARIGCGLVADRHKYSESTVAALLDKVKAPQYNSTAQSIGKIVREENGAQKAAEEISAVL